MFKVHLPATSYLRKQMPFFGTNHFFKALRSPLLKSAGLYVKGTDVPHSWAPTDAGLHPDPEVPDHQPLNHGPDGELLEGGFHPIDFVHNELVTKLNMDPKMAGDTIQRAIERYNEQHADDSNHHLPNFDSNQWRKVFVGPHYKNGIPTQNRQVRASVPNHEGGPTPLITYAYNQGNLPGGSTGQWIDSGFIHMNKELGQELIEMGAPPDYVNSFNFIKHPAILPGDFTGGYVNSVNKTDWNKFLQTGQMPNFHLTSEEQQSMAEQRMHPEIHPHQIPYLLPDSFFHPADRKTSAGGLTGEKLKQLLSGVDHGLSDEVLHELSTTRAMRLMYQEVANLDSDSVHSKGAVKSLVGALFNEMGASHRHEDYNMHLSHATKATPHQDTDFYNRAFQASQRIAARMSLAAGIKIQEGMSQDDAVNEVVQTMRNSKVNTGTAFSKPKEGMRELTEGVLDLLLGKTGHEKFSLGDIPTDRETQHLKTSSPNFQDHHSNVPEHWKHRYVSPGHVAPVHNMIGEPREEMGTAPSTIPPRQEEPPMAAPPMAAPQAGPQLTRVMPSGAPNIRQAGPAATAFQQGRGIEQGQTFFNPQNPQELMQQPIRTSHDVASGIDMIRKKMGYFDGFLRGEY